MKRLIIVLAASVFALESFAQNVTIGTQVWMTKNLNVDKFRNGDPIPQAKTYQEWEAAGNKNQPAWCYYENNPANGTKYGKLYNWYAVNDSRVLAPQGYHVPNIQELKLLVNKLGGENVAGGKMKSTSGWASHGFESNGSNQSKFSALPGGSYAFNGKWYFSGLKDIGEWWISSDINSNNFYSVFLGSGGEGWMGNSIDLAERNDEANKKEGHYVRCIKD